MTKSKVYLYFILTGVMLVLSFPPFPFFPLAFIAFVPLILAYEITNKNNFIPLYITFFIYHTGSNWWISSFQEQTDPYLMMSGFILDVFHPFFFMLPFILYRYMKLKLSILANSIYLFPLLWVVYEWSHSLTDLSYPWLTVGNTQIYNFYWIQFIDITGVWGSSFLLLLFNTITARMIYTFNVHKSIPDGMKYKYLKQSISLALIIIVPMIYGYFKISEFDHEKLMKSNKTVSIGVIQPNINPWNKWESGSTVSQIYLHKKIQDSLVSIGQNANLWIWSETAIQYINLDFNSRHNLGFLRELVDVSNSSLLTGFTDFFIYKKDEAPSIAKSFPDETSVKYDTFNSALLVNPNDKTQESQVYHKMKLTPFAERLPHAELFTFAKEWFEWGVGISSWQKGNNQKVLNVSNADGNYKIASIICIESIYPLFVSNFADLNADIFSIITNDAWYDYTPGPRQHYEIAAIRAIESRRYIARCANSGVSGFISPLGYSISELQSNISAGKVESLPLIQSKTFYVQFGDWIPILLSIITLSLLLLSIFRKR